MSALPPLVMSLVFYNMCHGKMRFCAARARSDILDPPYELIIDQTHTLSLGAAQYTKPDRHYHAIIAIQEENLTVCTAARNQLIHGENVEYHFYM